MVDDAGRTIKTLGVERLGPDAFPFNAVADKPAAAAEEPLRNEKPPTPPTPIQATTTDRKKSPKNLRAGGIDPHKPDREKKIKEPPTSTTVRKINASAVSQATL